MEVTEFDIQVPWGHVAAKAWGKESDTPVLTVHGLSDNAGSFDRLIPYLPTSFYYICIDLPSHGKSSPYPPHLFITALDNILTLKLLIDKLNRNKYILMGHSWGGQTAVLFTQLYPEHVLRLIVLDSFHFRPVEADTFKETLKNTIDGLIKINEKIANNKRQPYYTYDEAINKMISSRFIGMVLYKEAAEAIAKRALMHDGDNRYRFTTDPRLKYYTNLICDKQFILKIVKKYPLRCPSLFIYSTDTEFQYYFYKSIVDEYKKQNCTIVQVSGSHDVHNNNPDVVAPIISKFLTHVSSRL